MKRDFVIGMDLDGVVMDYNRAFGIHVAFAKGLKISEVPLSSQYWDFHKDPDWPINTREEYLELHTGAVRNGMFASMTPIPGAIKGMWDLSNQEAHIRVITHRFIGNGLHGRVVVDTAESLDTHGIPYRDLCFVNDKATVGCNLLVDDSPTNIKAYQDAGRDYIIFDQLYNQHLDGPRARGWEDLVEQITERMQ